jgi:hypothetical protein
MSADREADILDFWARLDVKQEEDGTWGPCDSGMALKVA